MEGQKLVGTGITEGTTIASFQVPDVSKYKYLISDKIPTGIYHGKNLVTKWEITATWAASSGNIGYSGMNGYNNLCDYPDKCGIELTVNSVISGCPKVGDPLSGPNINQDTKIIAPISVMGTYKLSSAASDTQSSETVTFSASQVS